MIDTYSIATVSFIIVDYGEGGITAHFEEIIIKKKNIMSVATFLRFYMKNGGTFWKFICKRNKNVVLFYRKEEEK